MVAAHRPKPPDKQELCRKVTTLLKKAYHGTPPKHDLPVLESLLYAVCLEDATPEAADASYKRLLSAFPDLNEARVSSITELQAVFQDEDLAAWRALRVKNCLQFAFDNNYAFELEGLKRKTVELAVKQLGKIPSLSWFVRGWTLQHALGSHVLPIDGRMHAALLWMGLVEQNSTPEECSETLRSYIRKADAPLFCHLLRCLSLDPKRNKVFLTTGKPPENSHNPDEGVHRLEVLITKGAAAVPKPTPVKPAPLPAKSKAESVKGDASRAEPAKPAVAKPVPGKAEPAKHAGKTEAPKANHSKSVHAKSPVKPAAGKSGSGKAETHTHSSGKGSSAKLGAGKGETKSESRGEGKKRS